MPSSSAPCSGTKTLLFLLALLCGSHMPAGGDLNQDIEINWGGGRGQMRNNGKLITLSLDRASGSGFQSKNEFLFGKFDMQIKLVPGNSAGTVTAFYTKSQGSSWDEIDFEFLGNLSGDPYILHTNVITPGNFKREQQFYLWFDPTADFHTYSILWNPQCIIFYVDGIPIREFKNYESTGVPFARKQPMRVYGSLWDAEDWATRGGLVKTNWSAAPFSASFMDFNSANACVWSSSSSSSSCNWNKSRPSHDVGEWIKQELDPTGVEKLRWVQRNYMIYNYCTDLKRIPVGLAPECTLTKQGEGVVMIKE